MAYLLDSHTLIWFLESATFLSPRVAEILSNETNRVFVSPASIYELGYKAARGKLRPLPHEFRQIIAKTGFEELPISFAAAERAARFPLVLRDPWDRMLAAQAIESGSILATADSHIKKLGVQTIW